MFSQWVVIRQRMFVRVFEFPQLICFFFILHQFKIFSRTFVKKKLLVEKKYDL